MHTIHDLSVEGGLGLVFAVLIILIFLMSPRVTSELVRRDEAPRRPIENPAQTQQESDRVAAAERLQALAERERDVFDALVLGLSNSEIAQQLWLSASTVKTHVGRILHKFGMRD